MQTRHWPVIIFIKKIVSGPGPGPSGASLITSQAVTALPGQASCPSLSDSCPGCPRPAPLSAFIASSNPFPSRAGQAGPEPAAVTPARPEHRVPHSQPLAAGLRLDAWPRPSLVKSQFGNIKTRNPDRRESAGLLDVGFIEYTDSHRLMRLRIFVMPAWFEFDEIRSDNRHSGISCRLAACLTIFNCQEFYSLCK